MFKQLLIGLVLVFGLTSCMTMPDGTTKPDYELIEVSAMAAMAVYVNEVEVSDAKTLATHNRLQALMHTLQCDGPDCPAFDLYLMESSIMAAMPVEYQALGRAGVRLIRSRAKLYLDPKLPEIENVAIVRNIAVAVVGGMVLAMEPKIIQIQGE